MVKSFSECIVLYSDYSPSRKFILEYYREFYATDICSKEPDACEWIGNQLKKNHEYIKRMVKQHAKTDSYWHLVGLFYKQMEGMTKGTYIGVS